MPSNKNSRAIILITALFFLWGVALNMNSILIPHLKKACQLNYTKSALIDSASFIAYFLVAFPAGIFMKRYGYKGGTIFGLILFATGAFLFYPASLTRSYAFFLAALFIIASGLAFLESAANPYMIVLGDPSTAARRLNFAQSFNGLGASLAALIGGNFILSGKKLSADEQSVMSAQNLNKYLNHEAASVQVPYVVMGLVVLLVAILLFRTHLPEIVEREETQRHQDSILKEKNLMFGVLAQFFYVGAQVCISSFFILFAELVGGLEEKPAANLLFVALLCFMIGRFVGTALIRFIEPPKLLAIYSIVNILLLCAAVITGGKFSVYSLLGIEFFMSIMFPTIFSLGVRGLGTKTKQGSSLLVMSIVGGAVFPVIMAKVSDASSIQTAYLVPAACFIPVLLFALKNIGIEKLNLVATANH
jgi:FHS family L-fucose permease-like MFS transporter